MSWVFYETDNVFTEDDIGDYCGFVYLITDTESNRKYIGKKLFTKASYKQVKGKKKKVRKSSDWESYFGSNKELQEAVKTNGVDRYRREILYLCKTKSECSYRETREIFTRDALLREDYYNSWVTCKIHKAHVINKM